MTQEQIEQKPTQSFRYKGWHCTVFVNKNYYYWAYAEHDPFKTLKTGLFSLEHKAVNALKNQIDQLT